MLEGLDHAWPVEALDFILSDLGKPLESRRVERMDQKGSRRDWEQTGRKNDLKLEPGAH